jgi:DNA-binding MarR family transcriptional regulator
MSANRAPTPDPLAVRLAMAIKGVYGRMREAALATSIELPIAQLAVLYRIRNEGATTAAALAVAEHVTHQAITQTLAALKREGLVRAAPDPKDGRKSLLSITAAGNRLFESATASRDAWLDQAIESAISPRERAALAKSIELLERLAATARPESLAEDSRTRIRPRSRRRAVSARSSKRS